MDETPQRAETVDLHSVIAGGGSGIVATVLCSPLDVAKTRQQVQASIGIKSPHGTPYNSGVFTALRSLWINEGLAGCFRGLGPALLTVPTFWAVYWPAYNKGKTFLGENAADMPTWSHHMASAVGAGAVADTITNPLWVIRTRMQAAVLRDGSPLPKTKTTAAASTAAAKEASTLQSAAASAAAQHRTHRHHSMGAVAADMLQHEGPRAFYKGLTATFLGLSHVAVQFPLYEHLKAVARDRRGGDAGSEEALELVLASATSKFVASIITYPHEVIRARMQFTLGTRYGPLPGLRQTMRAIIADAGVKGLYAGIQMNMLRVVPNCVSAFVTYEYILRWIKSTQDDQGGRDAI